jgi:hypothetical protein
MVQECKDQGYVEKCRKIDAGRAIKFIGYARTKMDPDCKSIKANPLKRIMALLYIDFGV